MVRAANSLLTTRYIDRTHSPDCFALAAKLPTWPPLCTQENMENKVITVVQPNNTFLEPPLQHQKHHLQNRKEVFETVKYVEPYCIL